MNEIIFARLPIAHLGMTYSFFLVNLEEENNSKVKKQFETYFYDYFTKHCKRKKLMVNINSFIVSILIERNNY